MANRPLIEEVFAAILGNRHVYVQPPASVKMVYPCIRIRLTGDAEDRADNGVYHVRNRYTVTYISRTNDLAMKDKIIHALPMCSFDRTYIADNLYHYVFNLYY